MLRPLALLCLFAFSLTPAMAGPCENFDLTGQKNDLEACLKELKFNQQLMQMQNDTVLKTVCALAMILANERQSSNRNADLDGMIKDICLPLATKKKKPAAKK